MGSYVLSAVTTVVSSTAPPPELPGFLNSLSSPLQHYGLWAILVLVFVEDFGIPVPGETVLIAGAIFAGSGRLNVVVVGLVGFFAAVLGDNVGYAIGRFGGRALVERWGKYIFLTPERVDKAEAFFHRHGGKIIIVARFIEGLRQANGIIAGISRMHWLRFLIFNAIGAALWVGTWVTVGYFAGRHITPIYHAITTYSLYVAIAAVVLIVAWIARRLYLHRTKATTAPVRAEASETAQASETAVAEPKAPLPGVNGRGSANGATGSANDPEATGATDPAQPSLGLGEVVAVGGYEPASGACVAVAGIGWCFVRVRLQFAGSGAGWPGVVRAPAQAAPPAAARWRR